MRKFFTAFITILIIVLTGWLIVPAHQLPQGIKEVMLTLSSDGPATPGQTQEYLVNAFSRKDGRLEREPGLQLNARLAFTRHPLSARSELWSSLEQTPEGSYLCRFPVPENMPSGSASLEIFPARHPDVSLLKCQVTIGHDQAIVVLPPRAAVTAGNWASFRIAALGRKSARGIFKAPVRVKMTPPSGHTTINRVVLTDLDGTAVFTTHIHSNAAQGLYRFDFFQGGNKLSLKTHIGSPIERTQFVKRLFERPGRLLPDLPALLEPGPVDARVPLYVLKNEDSQPASTMLSDIRPEQDQACLTYDCPDSEYRQIEVWQNGKIVYNSDLQLPSGRIAIPFPHGVQSSSPIFFKLWQLQGNLLMVKEQVLMPENPAALPAARYMAELDSMLSSEDRLPCSAEILTRPGMTAINLAGQVKCFTPSSQPEIVPELSAADGMAALPPDSMRLVKCDPSQSNTRQRFFLVENELQLSRYRFSSIKIWLDPARFFTSIISALLIEKPGIDFLLGEAECRALRCSLLGLSEHPAELEKLEGLMIPISEFYDLSLTSPAITASYRPIFNRAVSRLNKLIHLPDQISTFGGINQDFEDKIGPFSPILPSEISVDRLFTALKPGGKAGLVSGGTIIPVNLTGSVAVFRPKSQSGSDARIEKLINSRSTPIMVELEFSEATEY